MPDDGISNAETVGRAPYELAIEIRHHHLLLVAPLALRRRFGSEFPGLHEVEDFHISGGDLTVPPGRAAARQRDDLLGPYRVPIRRPAQKWNPIQGFVADLGCPRPEQVVAL